MHENFNFVAPVNMLTLFVCTPATQHATMYLDILTVCHAYSLDLVIYWYAFIFRSSMSSSNKWITSVSKWRYYRCV